MTVDADFSMALTHLEIYYEDFYIGFLIVLMTMFCCNRTELITVKLL